MQIASVQHFSSLRMLQRILFNFSLPPSRDNNAGAGIVFLNYGKTRSLETRARLRTAGIPFIYRLREKSKKQKRRKRSLFLKTGHNSLPTRTRDEIFLVQAVKFISARVGRIS